MLNLNPDSIIYALGKDNKMDLIVAQRLGYFATVYVIWQLVYMIQRFLFSSKIIYKYKLINSPS